MNLQQVGDVSFVSQWQRCYNGVCDLTKVAQPELPTPAYYKEFFQALDALIKTPVAFALLAPHGWSGEKCWYDYQAMAEFGWEPVYWKESTHKDKTFVQLYMRRLNRPDVLERPAKPTSATRSISYSGTTQCADLPYLGCSSILTAFDEQKALLPIPTPKMYADMEPEKCLHFLRIARPAKLTELAKLRKAGFERVAALKFNQYWVRGKPGIGAKDKCDY